MVAALRHGIAPVLYAPREPLATGSRAVHTANRQGVTIRRADMAVLVLCSFLAGTRVAAQGPAQVDQLLGIGDPAVPSLRLILQGAKLNERWVAVWSLEAIGSPNAMSGLRAHAPRESDRNLQRFIEKILAPSAPLDPAGSWISTKVSSESTRSRSSGAS